MEKAVAINELGAQSSLLVLTDSGRIYQYKPSTQPGTPGTWAEIILPPQMGVQEIKVAEKLNVGGRLPKGYDLYKRNDNGLFYWQRQEESGQFVTSESFERLEGAIGSARHDWMLRHPPAPPLKPEQPLPEIVR